MSDGELSDDDHQEILRRDILPLYFPTAAESADPTLVLLSGQPGAGRSRPTSQLIAERDHDLAVLNGDELRAFHPRFFELATARSAEAASVLSRASADWVRGCIRFARENRRSLLLEGTFPDPSVVTGTAARFTAEGFSSRVVVVASRRAESLMSVVSRYLSEVQAGVPAQYTSLNAHDRGFAATRTLVDAVEQTASVDRLTILGRDGQPVFDAHREGRTDAFVGTRAALSTAQSAQMSRFDATQWLSELHHVTDFAMSKSNLSRGVTESLVELHGIAINEVIPELHVPAAGKFATAMEQSVSARLVALRHSLRPAESVDDAAPVLMPGGPERGGLSR